jgi:CheY-like chemotaxis protein
MLHHKAVFTKSTKAAAKIGPIARFQQRGHPMFLEGQQILVIESDVGRREAARRILTEEGLAVTPVAEGLAALRVAAERRFALAVAALELPGSLDGLTTVRLIRARQPSLRVLYAGPAAARPPLLDPLFDEFIPLPYLRRELLGCVFELLQRRGAVRSGCGRAG